ncbi:DgyrCDS9655 [Dimorphilus gyrociliatus]|uniref:DgyrCDS9655 n=1 Tax=Dimorphilus gyrociliatus TaxID=2664684 RepID=A0A7I8VXM5_9ANNE|nr:DgyrCDS9655 [Dimorphilus gyrociliatus]
MDIYSREKEGAAQLKPYIKKILNSTYLLDSNFNDKKKDMDLSHAIYMAHKELSVDVFLNIELSYDYWKKKNVVNIRKPETPGYMAYYNDRDKLRKHMMDIAKTYLEDIGVKVDSAMDSKIKTFAYDATYIEWYIEWEGDNYNYYWYGSPSMEKIKDRSDLKLKSKQLDIIRILKEYYPRAEPITDYEVRADMVYLRGLDDQLQHFDRYIHFWGRDMNNFIFWRILFKMSPFLSSKYQVKHSDYVKNSYDGGYYYNPQSHTMECLSYLKLFVPEALVQWDIDAGEHSSQTFSQIDKILQNSFDGLRTYFTRSNSYMADQVTEDNMRKKKIGITLGKSDDLWESFKIKSMYRQNLNTDPKNFIGNIVNCSELRAHAESDALRSGNDKPVYMRHFFHSYDIPYTLANQIFIPMSFLKQPDQYIRNGPPALNLGSLGYFTLWEALDIAGFLNDIRYSYNNERRLLSLESFDRFKNLTRCIKQRNLEGKIFYTINVDGIEKRIEFGYGYSNDVWMHEAAEPVAENVIVFRSLINGLRSYRKQNSHSLDVKLPGMNFTGNQFVFLSSVQSLCEKVHPRNIDYQMKYSFFLPIDSEINVALQQIPEFGEAFQCKIGDKMRPNANCASLT